MRFWSFTLMTGMTEKNIQSTRVTPASLLSVTQTKFISPTTVEHQLSECQSSEPPPVLKKKITTQFPITDYYTEISLSQLKYHRSS